jgi:hypothetical protein
MIDTARLIIGWLLFTIGVAGIAILMLAAYTDRLP